MTDRARATSGSGPTRYELRVRGHLSREVSDDFDDFDVRAAPAETVMVGQVTDDAHLHGVLARLQALGLQVVSLRSVPDQAIPPTPPGEPGTDPPRGEAE